jgi:hypothetical protein
VRRADVVIAEFEDEPGVLRHDGDPSGAGPVTAARPESPDAVSVERRDLLGDAIIDGDVSGLRFVNGASVRPGEDGDGGRGFAH